MTCAGIDVAKKHLDLAIRFGSEEVETHHFENDSEGITQLEELLREADPERIVLEATGGYEQPVSAALSATRCNQKIRAFYDRLTDRGKAKKTALVACMRKLLVIMNTMMKNGTQWNSEYQTSST
ncbi:transposase [Salinibacter sp. 10B]|uniref:IS110 family transposase n=1 Tax=Salinibacter sp. 10B TaxID=1923971 RepID=UPI0011AFDA77